MQGLYSGLTTTSIRVKYICIPGERESCPAFTSKDNHTRKVLEILVGCDHMSASPSSSSSLGSRVDSIEVTSGLPLGQPLVEELGDGEKGGPIVIEHLKAIAESQSIPHFSNLLVEELPQYFVMRPAGQEYDEVNLGRLKRCIL